MISVRNLSKAYGPALAVKDVSFEIGKGEVVGFLGPNGAGKTTTLRMLSGCLPPTSGTAELLGRDICLENLEVRKRIGYLPENNPLYEEMDVSEYLEWTAEARGLRGEARGKGIRDSVESCGLGDVLGKPIGLLSKGYRQRVGLAAAILHDPEILLLDEPTSGLDPNQAREVRELIQSLKRAKTVLLSTHILPEVENSCDRVIIIHKGSIAASGSPRELTQSATGRGAIQLALKADEIVESLALENIRRLKGVARAELRRDGSELRFEVVPEDDAGDLREELFHLAVRKRWTLLRLNQEGASLEHVFRELTLK